MFVEKNAYCKYLCVGATGGNIYDNREGGRPKSKAVRQGGGQGEDMIGIMGYSQDGVYDNPSHIGGEDNKWLVMCC